MSSSAPHRSELVAAFARRDALRAALAPCAACVIHAERGARRRVVAARVVRGLGFAITVVAMLPLACIATAGALAARFGGVSALVPLGAACAHAAGYVALRAQERALWPEREPSSSKWIALALLVFAAVPVAFFVAGALLFWGGPAHVD